MNVESLLLAVTIVNTMSGPRRLTNATGFFFVRDERLFLVTNRHVLLDEPSDHRPDRLEIELHVAPDNVALTTQFSIPLYRDGKPVWREGNDAAGPIDVGGREAWRCTLWTDGPATLTVETALYPRVEARLAAKRGKCTVKDEIVIGPLDGGM